jgi:hypothetical protein
MIATKTCHHCGLLQAERRLKGAEAEVARLQTALEGAEVQAEVLAEGVKEGLSHLDHRYSDAPPGQHRVHEGEAITALTGALAAIDISPEDVAKEGR